MATEHGRLKQLEYAVHHLVSSQRHPNDLYSRDSLELAFDLFDSYYDRYLKGDT